MPVKFQTLTRQAMRALAAKQKLSEHGISFERMVNGDGRFTINIMVDGKRIHRVIGKESDGTTRTQAEEAIAKLRQDSKHNRLNLPTGRKLSQSFSDAAKAYLSRLGIEGGKDISKKQARLKLHLIPFFKDTLLSQITTTDVERYKQYRQEQQAKLSTINRDLAILSHLLNKAVEWHWLESKPCLVKKFKEEATRFTYLTSEESKHLLEVAKTDQCAQIYPFIFIGLATTMRLAEILSIKLEHIDVTKHRIYIPKAKAGARSQPITKQLAQFLQGYLDVAKPGEIWLFASPRSVTGHTVNITKAFRRVVETAGLDKTKVTPHTLRHTAITHLVQAGVDLPTVQRISGHKTLQMVVRYSHQNGEHIREAMDSLESRYSLVD